MENPPKVGFVSLGCPKALVDSEHILTQLHVEGYQIVPSYDQADLVVVNTCGFIEAAVEESLDAIGESLHENGKVVVTGCLGARDRLIRERFPEVLAITGPARYEEVMAAIHAHLPPEHDPRLDLIPSGGVKLTPRHYAYLKISEGCNHRCSFCIIPSMRGDLVSRPIDEVLREAETLVASGVKELLVIAQDTSAYGVDVAYRSRRWRRNDYQTRLADLAMALGELGVWVRLHYVYPYPHVDDLIPLMAQGTLLPYLDVPLQHASVEVLKRMRRPAATAKTLERIRRWREVCPELTIRSTFIVGFPGETEQDFEQLLDFLQQAQLDRVGCFKYSPVTGAAANAFPDPVSDAIKEQRYDLFMQTQATISAARLREKIGTVQEVLVDEVSGYHSVARSRGDAPEIDGVVHISDASELRPGELVKVEIIDSDEHDLNGRIFAHR
jgi:ribosomal protein S12 methylthiotransferase